LYRSALSSCAFLFSFVTMPVVRKIHWRTPAALVSSLFAGIALALGHHFLYQTLAGTTVHDTSRDIIGYGISSQQMNIAAGTALAFLVKVCLVLSVTIAYTQVFWKAIGHRETRIDTIDIIDSALGNIFMFLKVRVWWKYPLLLSLALSVWSVCPCYIRASQSLTFAGSFPLLPR
jgi:hypothetical protein